MSINRLTALFSAVILFVCMSSQSYAAVKLNQNDPVAVLQFIGDNMIEGLKKDQATLKSKPEVVKSLAYKFIVPYADLNTMAKQVLPPVKWTNATATERTQFQHEFTQALIRTYASALTSYANQTLKFFPPRGNTNVLKTVVVEGEIDNGQSQPVHVSYRLIHTGSQWRLIDMSVEGVSLVDSFRSQFADMLENGNMKDLLSQMQTHNN